MINVWIDELTPCLRDAETNELVDTEVLRIKRKSFLQKYSKKNGWYVNWADLLESYEVYALVLEGTIDIQGLVAVKRDVERGATYIAWMCASPENNKQIRENVRFNGVGGHLFAIAIQKSVDYGQQGAVYGFAANEELLEHYMDKFHANYVGILHKYHFAIDDVYADKIMEEYTYAWTDEEI